MRPTYASLMRILRFSALVGCAATVQAQESEKAQIATHEELYQAVAQRYDSDEAARMTIQDVLQRMEVRQIVDRYGLDLKKASEGVAALRGAELSRLAAQAHQLDDSIAGGDLGDIELALVILLAVITTIIVIEQAYNNP